MNGEATALKVGDERMRIVVVTKHELEAEVTFERLRDDVELTPTDMAFMRKALKKAYPKYKGDRMRELDALKGEPVAEEAPVTNEPPMMGSGFVVDKVEEEAKTEVSMEVIEPAVSVIENDGDGGYDD